MKNVIDLRGLKWILPGLLCLVFSCTKTMKPEGILTREEMVKVMIEIYIAEDKVNRLTLTRDTAEKVFDSLQVRFFQKLNIPDTTFRRSMAYYNDRPKEMEQIFTAVVDSLQLREQKTISRPGDAP